MRPVVPVKGRGAVTNPTGRFERERREFVDDGWTAPDGTALAPGSEARLATTVTVDASRTIIARNESPDVPFDRSINPYRGCEHGCVYCYARPSHAWLGLSPGLDFESRLFAKPEAARLLREELAAPRYRCRPIALGTNTDPYQPIERRLRITRGILEVLSAHDHPVTIVTKSASVVRDLDILADLAERNLVRVGLSITTLDRELARRLEPRASTPALRLDAVGRLAAAGVPTGVMVAPIIPALTDGEIEAILEAAAGAGASSAGYVLLRLPGEVGSLFAEWLDAHAPLAARRVLALVRETRGGRLNDAAFGVRMRGSGPYAEMIRRRFDLARRRLGLDRDGPPLDCDRFRPPRRPGDQLELF